MTAALDIQDRRDIYLPRPATVREARALTAHETFMVFEADEPGSDGYLPGQFMEVTVPGIGEAPISISSSPTRTAPGVYEMVVRRVGNVTAALHRLQPGARVGLRGPFGTHFPVEGALKGQDLLFVCGGLGLVPVRSGIHYVLDHRADYGQVTILIGTRSPADRLYTDEIEEWAARDDVTLMETVDRADPHWRKNVGVITGLMLHLDVDPACTVAVVCGPPIMYKFVLLELYKLRIDPYRMYVSLERHMRCGVGKCGHCQINGIYACQDGPVFRYDQITAVREAI